MPRVVGMFMVALGGLISEFVRARDYRYYLYAIVARSFIVLVMTALYFVARDPLFLSMWLLTRPTHAKGMRRRR